MLNYEPFAPCTYSIAAIAVSPTICVPALGMSNYYGKN